MGILKKAAKALGGVAKAGMTIPGTNIAPAQALFGTLGQHLGEENKRHKPHEKVKEIHHHYHDKKHKKH